MMTRDIHATYGILSKGKRSGAADAETGQKSQDCFEVWQSGVQAHEDSGERVYGVNHFRASLHICLPDPSTVQGHIVSPDRTEKTALQGGNKVTETLIIRSCLNHLSETVTSRMGIVGHRRHRDEASFRFVMSPVKYADTAYVYRNSTKKRYVNRVCYEPRIKTAHFSDTIFSFPATLQEKYTTTVEHRVGKHNKHYKTILEIEARDVKSSKQYSSPRKPAVNIPAYCIRQSASTWSSRMLNGLSCDLISGKKTKAGGDVNNNDKGMGEGKSEPGASQVLIPKRPMCGVEWRVRNIE